MEPTNESSARRKYQGSVMSEEQQKISRRSLLATATSLMGVAAAQALLPAESAEAQHRAR